jgi:hypothetical protein
MFKLDNEFLIELGLGALPADEKNKMLAHIYETLEMRVGMKLAEQMTDAQLDEFESYINRNDEAGALTWLETNFPNYKNVVAEELEKLKAEISQVAPQIVSDSMNNAQLADGAGAPSQQAPQEQAAPAQYQQPPVQQTIQQDPYAAQQQMPPQYQQPQMPQQPQPSQQPGQQYPGPAQYQQPAQPAPQAPTQPWDPNQQ